MTRLMYLENQKLFQIPAKIIHYGVDDKGDYIIFDQTIMYPQGGGQPCDRGKIQAAEKSLAIYEVRYVDNDVRHYVTNFYDTDDIINSEVIMSIDADRRVINTRYHSAGHLISAVIEDIYPNLKAVKGHQFPGEAYIELIGNSTDINIDQLNNKINNIISSGGIVETQELDCEKDREILNELPYAIPKNKKLRVCKIIDYKPVPCGGTHVANLSELDKVMVTKIKSKQGKIKVSYELVDESTQKNEKSYANFPMGN